jgi:hypothetical protein
MPEFVVILTGKTGPFKSPQYVEKPPPKPISEYWADTLTLIIRQMTKVYINLLKLIILTSIDKACRSSGKNYNKFTVKVHIR